MRAIKAILATILCSLTFASQCAVAADAAQDTRYVWANNLILRAQADSKSAEVARLLFGTAVKLLPPEAALVPHQEVFLKLTASSASPAADVVLDGNWRHVSAAGGDGWVFDGYLSRYPARKLSADRSKQDDESEADFAKRVFGTAVTYKWATGDNKKSADYRAMLKHTKLSDKQTSEEVNWEYAEYKGGGGYELYAHQAEGGMGTSTIDFRNLPLSYNEALIWLKQFGGLAPIGGNGNGIGKFSGKLVPGKHLELGPTDNDDSGFGFSRSIDCTSTTCSLNYGFAD